jgi:SAM-dependent methyltransferase
MTDELARSQQRWRGDENPAGLTWGVEMTGDPFVDFLLAHATPAEHATIVEIGPGYGRITASLIGRVPFSRYIGLEISAARVKRLRERFTDPRLKFREADILAGMDLGRMADLTIGSAVFEHFYPDFARVLAAVGRFTGSGGQILFDLLCIGDALASSDRWSEEDGTYIRVYSIAELIKLFGDSPFALDALGHISLGRIPSGQEMVRTIVRGTKRDG